MRQISAKAVIVGSLFDIIGTQLLLVLLIIAICIPLLGTGQIDAAQIRAALDGSILYKVGGYLIGGLMSVAAGYVAAAIAKRGELVNGALSAVLCVAVGVYALLSGTAGQSPWVHALDIVLAPALGVFGGYLRARGRAQA